MPDNTTEKRDIPDPEENQDEDDNEDDDDDDDGPALTPVVLKFLNTERGHQLANRGMDLIDGFKKATLDAQARANELNGKLAAQSARQTFWLQTLGLIAVVGSIVWLSASNNLKAEASTILGAVAGYLFAQRPKPGS